MSRLAVCVHELGHGLVIEGLTSGRVTVIEVDSAGRSGVTRHSRLWMADEILLSCISGRVGELVALGGRPLMWDDGDMRSARAVISIVRGVEPDGLGDIETTVEYRQAEQQVRAYLVPRTDLMRALAYRLYAHGYLDGGVIRDALARFDERDLHDRLARIRQQSAISSDQPERRTFRWAA